MLAKIKKIYWELNAWFPIFVALCFYKLYFVEGYSLTDISYHLWKESGEVWPHDFLYFIILAIWHLPAYLWSLL